MKKVRRIKMIENYNLTVMQEVEIELKRFNKKLQIAIKEYKKNPDPVSSKEFAAVKRSAMDLKNELTKITQSSKLKWE